MCIIWSLIITTLTEIQRLSSVNLIYTENYCSFVVWSLSDCCFIPHKTPPDCRWPCPAASFPHEYFKFHSGYRPRDPKPYPHRHCDCSQSRYGALSCPDRRHANHLVNPTWRFCPALLSVTVHLCRWKPGSYYSWKPVVRWRPVVSRSPKWPSSVATATAISSPLQTGRHTPAWRRNGYTPETLNHKSKR